MKTSQRALPAVHKVLPWVYQVTETLLSLLSLQRKHWRHGHLCRDQIKKPSAIDVQAVVERCVCISVCSSVMGTEGRQEGAGVWEGREVVSCQFGAQTSQSIVSQTPGIRTGWGLSSEDRFLPEHFILLVRRKWTWCFRVCLGGPRWGEGCCMGGGSVCHNLIPLLMFDNGQFWSLINSPSPSGPHLATLYVHPLPARE